ncbi:MAG: flagellar motor switch protein FliN [Acidobacteriota bacterium]|jgi:flagellar motor switch protein FliN/FliY|nr:flagellar motor switch protein FliN [Acidobacteriota bacterium]
MPESMENEPVSYEKASEELQFFGDVPFGITVQLGERRMNIGDILQLQIGSVISLSKSAGENVDVLINGRLVAFGEVMELEGSTGIRITELNFSE